MECMCGQFLQAESTEKLKAENYECNDERTDYRNGTRERRQAVLTFESVGIYIIFKA